jgi:threonine synthase
MSTVLFSTRCTRCDVALDEVFSPFCPSCNVMTDVRYDLSRVELRDAASPYIRFGDLLPVIDASLLPSDAEPTRTVHAVRLGERAGLPWLYLKDETTLPTGTTKDRMAAVALPYLSEHGVETFCTSSTGNSSTAYAHALWRTPGLRMSLFTAERFVDRVGVPPDAPVTHFGLRGATFVEAFDTAKAYAVSHGLTAERGFFNPGRREGLKLAWLEAADQVPRPIDWYVQAVSSAMGVYGVARGAQQLLALGIADRLPHLLCVQQDTCAPMVSAWEAGSPVIRTEDIVERPTGIAEAILRGNPIAAYPPVHSLVVQFGGAFLAVSEREIRDARSLVENDEGMSPCFAASAAVAGALKARHLGMIGQDETVLVNLSGGERPEGGTNSGNDVRWLRYDGECWIPEKG